MPLRAFALLLVVFCSRVAQAASVTATADRVEASMQEPITLQVTVNGSQSAEPSLPELPMFEVHSRGKSTRIQMINGHFDSSATYTFTLVAKRAGTFTVPSISASIDGKTYESEAFTVTISQTASAPPSQHSPLFIIGEVSSKTPFVGQQVVYTWRFYRRVRVGAANVTLPDFEQFTVENLGDRREFETVLHGQHYIVTEVRKALFAQEAGKVEIPAASLQCEVFTGERGDDSFGGPFDDFFGRGSRVSKVLRSTPITVEVQPLPAVPPNFSDLIGDVSIAAQVSQHELHVGDSATLSVTVSGSANVKRALMPQMPPLSTFKVYDDKPTVNVQSKGTALFGSKTFKKALVPTHAGEVTVGPFSLTYFDPDTSSMRIAHAPPITMKVLPGDGSSSSGAAAAPVSGVPAVAIPTPTAKVDVDVLAEDILPIYERDDALPRKRFGRAQEIVWALVFGLPPGFFAAMAVVLLRRRQTPTMARRRRRSGALKKALLGHDDVIRLAGGSDFVAAAALASQVLRTFLGDKIATEGLALTASEWRAGLLAKGVVASLACRAEAFLSRCETAQYGAEPISATAFAPVPIELKALLGDLDRVLK